ncbi:trigger factor [Dorea acetigenes]|uniref:peptidylprolyl isomerase n=1 Tax=Dorea acetigenes TaxID=2981787 RepID=A0ABT2RRW7_9FIRM|nr:trigger factor [Dorea acetigenes]MCU6687874.1 trigger factor [Dorea acetigenes]SCJ59123.1 Trigger factor [uncultured Clostridium sp.]
MKKKLIVAVTGICMIAGALSGCSSDTAENDYVSVSGYKGIEIDKVDVDTDISDEDVENEINSVLEENATDKEVTGRAAQLGDTADINYVGKVDGQEFDGGSADNYPLELGSGSFIDGFEDSIVGHNVGETFDWNGKFPDDYQNTDLAGKDVVFTITVNALTEPELPELTDDFVKTVSEESETVEEYREEVRKNLEETAQENYDSELNSAVWEAVLEKAEVKGYPDGEVDRIYNTYLEQYQEMASYYNMEYDEFIQLYTEMTVDEFEEEAKEAAKDNIKQSQVAEVIAEKEGLTLTDEEYEKEFEKLAEDYGYEDVDDLKEVAGEETLKQLVLQPIVQEWLAENCVQKETDDGDK